MRLSLHTLALFQYIIAVSAAPMAVVTSPGWWSPRKTSRPNTHLYRCSVEFDVDDHIHTATKQYSRRPKSKRFRPLHSKPKRFKTIRYASLAWVSKIRLLGQIETGTLFAKRLESSVSTVKKQGFQIAISKHRSYEVMSALTGKLSYATGRILRMTGFQARYDYRAITRSKFSRQEAEKEFGS